MYKVIFLVVLTTWILTQCNGVIASLPDEQVSALHDFYNATDGSNWQWEDVSINGPIWHFTAGVNPCDPLWQGLECACSNISCNVTTISLGSHNLRGYIPVTLLNLTELHDLQLQFNYVEEIPSFIGLFTELEFLDMSSNELNGTIPESVGQLTKLEYLILRRNNLTGTVPASMSNMVNIIEIDLQFNRMSGQLTQFIDLTSLEFLALEFNQLTGSIPSKISRMINLQSLQLRGNYISGTMTDELCSMTSIGVLDLALNNITGIIPSSLSGMTSLQILDISDNDMTGSIPDVLGTMTKRRLNQVFLENNQFTGSIPSGLIDEPLSLLDSLDVSLNLLSGSIGTMNMVLLVFSDWSLNSFTGSIPESLCDCTLMAVIYFNNNQFEGTIPSCLGGLRYIEILHFEQNMLTGPFPETTVESHYIGNFFMNQNFLTSTIPPSICMNKLQALNMGENIISGIVPECLGNVRIMLILNVSYNVMTGQLPKSISNLSLASTLAFNDNNFYGTLPDISTMKDLLFFYAQNNQFTGNLEHLVLNTTTQSLSFVDVSNNQLTGSLPAALFPSTLPLISFAAAVNCLSGTLPPELCDLQQLLFLDLDGVSTAESCRTRIFPKSKVLTSFVLKNEIQGNIPSCLFSMPALNTLHLSGNSIRGSLTSDLVVSDSLQELSLSHNVLSGAIPDSIQEHSWSVLDLSYNKLSGVLRSDISLSGNASLVLQVNRISGNVPSSLLSLESINILTGNLFGCSHNRKSLPPHDQGYSNYECGSDSFNSASIAWMCFAGVNFIVIALFRNFWRSDLLEAFRSSYLQLIIYFRAVNHEIDSFEFKKFALLIQNYVVGFTVVLLVGFVPLYAGLKVQYYTVLHQYAWTVSAAFMSGLAPAVVVCFFYIGIITGLYLLWEKHHNSASSYKQINTKSVLQAFSLVVVVVIDAVVISIVNGVFVYVILKSDSTVIFLAQVSIAAFKLVWNEYAVRGLMSLSRQFHTCFRKADEELNLEEEFAVEMPYRTFIVLFNSIIAPCLATAAVDSNCFLNVFVAPSPVTTQFPDFNCNIIQIQSEECTEATSFESFLTIQYDPPFIYSYQCSSSILTNYASVYVFLYLIIAFLKPVTLWLMIRFYSDVPKRSCLHVFLESTLSNLLKPANPKCLTNGKILFHKERFILRAVSKIAVLLTFGVVFPPIAFVLCIAFMVESYINLIMMGRFLVNIGDDLILRQKFHDKLRHDSEQCMDLLLVPLTRLVVPFAAIFYAFFVLDIYGDAVGFERAVWAPLLLLCTPVTLGLVHIVKKNYVVGVNKKMNIDTKPVEIELSDGTLNAVHDGNEQTKSVV